MTKTAVAIRHVAFEDAGVWREPLAEAGYDLSYVEAGVDALADAARAADLVIVLGGPIGVYETDAYPFLVDEIAVVRRRLEAGAPIVGVCLGAQLMAVALGARVAPGPGKEIGYAPVALADAGRASPLARLDGLPVLHWHGDACELPPGALLLASTPLGPVQAFSRGPRALALQFHVEADPHRIEQWLIGHAAELAAAGLDPRALRADALRHGEATAAAGRALLAEWLGTSAP
ncbi:GMP synthase (glutamine-hydrolysing) [Roseiarcus fermentans]|uniref:GMP synthase (Glutamine-hydrolysing) n=1 Tax=Roseiarcus fermentans TaxID=1473586 RepID=A0A366FTV7_9HYPH|nr:glutamine amidotransferase [Roseiarcus fermentans]RBP17129.1 GMP synthase (glutamine-hydrolysing) [Roseiarcus fermentans]